MKHYIFLVITIIYVASLIMSIITGIIAMFENTSKCINRSFGVYNLIYSTVGFISLTISLYAIAKEFDKNKKYMGVFLKITMILCDTLSIAFLFIIRSEEIAITCIYIIIFSWMLIIVFVFFLVVKIWWLLVIGKNDDSKFKSILLKKDNIVSNKI